MYFRILASCLATFGLGINFFYYLIKVPLKIIYVNFSLFLDNIFFPEYRRIKIENPIFIIGHPRSATTFLHTILTQTEEYLVFKEWELVNPSLTIRNFIKHSKTLQGIFAFLFDFRLTPHKLKTLMGKIGKEISQKEEFGTTVQNRQQVLGLIAQEEEPIFLNILDSQFLPLVTPLGFWEKGYPELCFSDEQPHQEKSVLFLKSCFKRQIYYTGKNQILAKMNFSALRLKTMLKFFPDAKIIYIARSPLDTIPSHLSLHYRRLDRNFGLDNIPEPNLKQYVDHRYKYNLQFYKYVETMIRNNEIPKNQLLEISYNSMKTDLRGVIDEIKRFTGLQFSDKLEKVIDNQHERQSSYKRQHQNLPLEAFGLTEEKIRSDFDFVFKRYGFK
jgi:hypothetical protein